MLSVLEKMYRNIISLGYLKYIVTCITIARQRLGKHISAGVKARNSLTSIARQLISKHASLRTEAVFSASSVLRSYLEDSWRYRAVQGSNAEC
jgi:hypothetical protein